MLNFQVCFQFNKTQENLCHYIRQYSCIDINNHKVNVHDLETVVESASMGGGEIFRAKAELMVPAEVDIDSLGKELEAMANDLMVDISFVT